MPRFVLFGLLVALTAAWGVELTPRPPACEVCDPVAAGGDPNPSARRLALAALAVTDVRGANEAVDTLRLDLERLPAPAREEVAAGLRELTVSCALTRASVQIPLALHPLVMGIDPDDVDPLVDRDVASLQRGLSAHVALLEGLGVGSLPLPEPGDALYDVGPPGASIDRAQLELAPSPLAACQPLVTAIAEAPDDAILEGLVRQRIALERLTGHDWAFQGLLAGWHAALRRIEPFVVDPATAGRVHEAVELLDQYVQPDC